MLSVNSRPYYLGLNVNIAQRKQFDIEQAQNHWNNDNPALDTYLDHQTWILRKWYKIPMVWIHCYFVLSGLFCYDLGI